MTPPHWFLRPPLRLALPLGLPPHGARTVLSLNATSQEEPKAESRKSRFGLRPGGDPTPFDSTTGVDGAAASTVSSSHHDDRSTTTSIGTTSRWERGGAQSRGSRWGAVCKRDAPEDGTAEAHDPAPRSSAVSAARNAPTQLSETDQKRKSLWGRKRAAADESSAGTAHWQAAASSLGDRRDGQKFLRLMGAKPPSGEANKFHAAHVAQNNTSIANDLERNFSAGQAYRNSRLGLGTR